MTGATGQVVDRRAVRAVVRDGEGAVLLLLAVDPADGLGVWVTPGGGLEPGEETEDGLRREVFEETGLAGFAIGPLLWTRHDDFRWAGKRIRQDEAYYLVEVERFEACPDGLLPGVERDSYGGCRWWTPEDIRASAEEFAPQALGDLLTTLDTHGPARHPPHLTR